MFKRPFSKRNKIIKTDSSLQPSKRYEAVLFNTLKDEGYRYIKSKNEFKKDFDLGTKIITLSYNSSFGYISSVQYFAKIIFADLEKAFKSVYPKYGWTNWTIHYNLHWTESWLCNESTGEYTDESLNIVANEFFETIKKEIDSIFTQIDNYEKLYSIYLSSPTEFIDFLPPSRLEKRIINGLILVQNFTPDLYEETKVKFLKLLDKYKGNDIKEIQEEVFQGIEYLDNNSVKLR